MGDGEAALLGEDGGGLLGRREREGVGEGVPEPVGEGVWVGEGELVGDGVPVGEGDGVPVGEGGDVAGRGRDEDTDVAACASPRAAVSTTAIQDYAAAAAARGRRSCTIRAGRLSSW